MPLTEKEMLLDIPALFALIAKLIRFSKGGISKEEGQELGMDLVSLGLKIGTQAVDKPVYR